LSVTIKDIARAAGVSHPTVSRALRDHPAIAPETVARIKRIAEDMGYTPSALARGLKTNRSQALGVIVSRIDDPFFSEVLQGIEDVLRGEGYSLFLAASNRDPEREQAIIQAMGERRVDGVIVCSPHVSLEHGRQLKRFGVPIVVVNNEAAEEYRYSIYHDDYYGSQEVTRHLIHLGHRRIAYLGNAASSRTTQDRLAGFRKAMNEAGLPIPEEYIFQAPNSTPDGGMIGAHYFLNLPIRPTGIVCFNDVIAIGVLRGLQEAGLRVPDDCSVAGFDNIAFSELVTPPLTTFHQPKYQLGQSAAHMMMQLLDADAEAPESPRILVLRGELLPRASTAPPPLQ